jgi:F0F1-type ATP synthase assembly protein I
MAFFMPNFTVMKAHENKIVSQFASYGIIAGVVLGVLTDNLGFWIPMGLVFGAATGYAKMEKKKDGLE